MTRFCKDSSPYILDIQLLFRAREVNERSWSSPSIFEIPLLLSQRATKLR